MTNFTWNNGTELKPVPLTNSQTHKFAEIIRDQNINKSISGVICFLEEPDIEDELTLSGQLNLQIVRAYTDEDEMKNIPVTITGVNPFTITSTLVILGNFVCPEGITEEDGVITITNDYIPNEESLEFITFRMCSGRNFPLGGIPINLNDFFNASESSDDSNLDDEDYSYLMTNFTSNPVIVNKFIKYPRLAEIFRRHLDLFDFIYKVNPEELITFFTVSEETINGYASEGTFDRLKTYLKIGHNYEFIKFINDAPCYYTNIFVNTGWTNLAVYKNLVCVDNSIPRIDMSEYDMPTIFRGNITGYSGSNSKNPLVDGTITSPLAITAFADRKISGVPDAVDGISLVHFLNIAPTIETLTDNTEGWTMVRNNLGMFTGLKHLQLGCDVIDVTPASYSNFIGTSNYEDLDLSKVKKVYIRNNSGCVSAPNAVVDLSGIEEFYGHTNHHSNGYALISACANESLDLSKLHKIESTGSAVGGNRAVPIVANSSALKNIDLSSMAAFNTGQQSANNNKTYYFRNCPNVESIKVGKLTSFNSINFMCYGDDNTTMQKLVNFEIGAGTAISLNLAYWNPTNVLADADKTATFLQNFLEHICQRLANRTGQTKLTLTLSAAVYSAIGFSDNTIVDTEDVRYQIKQELLNRNWKVTDGTNTFNG